MKNVFLERRELFESYIFLLPVSIWRWWPSADTAWPSRIRESGEGETEDLNGIEAGNDSSGFLLMLRWGSRSMREVKSRRNEGSSPAPHRSAHYYGCTGPLDLFVLPSLLPAQRLFEGILSRRRNFFIPTHSRRRRQLSRSHIVRSFWGLFFISPIVFR